MCHLEMTHVRGDAEADAVLLDIAEAIHQKGVADFFWYSQRVNEILTPGRRGQVLYSFIMFFSFSDHAALGPDPA